MSDQTSDSDLAGSTGPRVRQVLPFEFLSKPATNPVPSFEEYLASRNEPSRHPSVQDRPGEFPPIDPALLGDVPEDDDD